jgi:hypothetical protein
MEAIIKKLYNEKNQEIGLILTAKDKPNDDVLYRGIFEYELKAYAETHLNFNENSKFYREIYDNVPSIIVIRNIDDLPFEEKEIDFKH